MATFFSSLFTTSDTAPLRVVEADSADREVLLDASSGAHRLGFSEQEATQGGIFVVPGPPLRFILPRGEELWTITTTGSEFLSVLVTKPGGA